MPEIKENSYENQLKEVAYEILGELMKDEAAGKHANLPKRGPQGMWIRFEDLLGPFEKAVADGRDYEADLMRVLRLGIEWVVLKREGRL